MVFWYSSLNRLRSHYYLQHNVILIHYLFWVIYENLQPIKIWRNLKNDSNRLPAASCSPENVWLAWGPNDWSTWLRLLLLWVSGFLLIAAFGTKFQSHLFRVHRQNLDSARIVCMICFQSGTWWDRTRRRLWVSCLPFCFCDVVIVGLKTIGCDELCQVLIPCPDIYRN